jgi:hypothetical protein
MNLQIRFWWPGFTPEDALTSFDPTVIETPFEGSADGGKTWRHPRPGKTLQTVYEWMIDHDCTVVDTQLVDERRNGGWEGRYMLTIGRNGKQGGR